MTTALAIGGGLLAVLVLLLASEMAVRVRVERRASTRVTWRFRWAYGAVRVRGPKPDAGEKARKKARKDEAARPPSRSRGGAAVPWALLRTRGFVARARRLVAGLVRRVHVDELSARAEWGLPDPADTGRVHGVLAPILLLADARGYDLRFAPRFVQPGLEGVGQVRVRLRPLALIPPLVAFACSPEAWRGARAAWRASR